MSATMADRRKADERGAVAVLVALFLATLLIITAMVLDFGLVRVDRQVNKSAADAATTSGLQGLAGSDGKAYPFRGICTAIGYLQKNALRFSGVSSGTGTWRDGNDGPITGDPCATANALQNQRCVPTNKGTWGKFSWTGNYQGEPVVVAIESGYVLSGSGWQEESLAAVAADSDDGVQGCYQLAVTVTQNREPGLGSLATSSDLRTSVRSVGRVKSAPGGDAPAMLLLRRNGCPILQSGANNGTSYIHVFGAVSSDGRTQAGTIHADSDGSSCSGGSNQNIFLGKGSHGIVAYAAPLSAASPTTPDPAKPGVISSVAGSLNITGGVIRDSLSNAYAATGIGEGAPGTATEPSGRSLVTRGLVDDRYLGLGSTPFGVRQAVSTAQSVFSTISSAAAATSAGWKVIPNCDPTNAEVTAAGITTTSDVFVNCTAGYKGTQPIVGSRVLFNGPINPPSTAGTSVSMPNATKVYVAGSSGDAISIGNNSALRVNNGGTNVDSTTGLCTTDVDGSKAVMVIKDGQLKQTGGVLQLCRTTVITMGGFTSGCLPTTSGTAPTDKPCGGTSAGTSQVSLTGNSTTIDWVAPNTIDITTDNNGDPLPAAVTAWHDADGPEDLALWTESYGGNSNPTYSMGGGGVMHTVGVFMAPNAAPFTISGNATQDLTNAQYIATSIDLNGADTAIKMSVDPNSAVTLPELEVIGLVR